MLGALEAHLRGSIYDGYVRRLMVDGFGVTDVAGEGRFGAVEEWLECPSDDNDDRSSDDTDDTAMQSWPIVQTVLHSVQRTLGMAAPREESNGLARRNRGVRRRRHHKRTGGGLWGWLTGSTAGDEERWDDDVLCPYAWARDIHELNCAFPIWPAELDATLSSSSDSERGCMGHDHEGGELSEGEVDEMGRRPRPHPELLELDTPQYAGRVREGWVVERLLAMAGIRLAGILNGLVLGEVDVRLH